MKDRIEIVNAYDKDGKEILKFYVHCDLGMLWLFNKPKTKGVLEYFERGRSVNELFEYKYKKNETLNKIITRLPVHIKYAKQIAIEERNFQIPEVKLSEPVFRDLDERVA